MNLFTNQKSSRNISLIDKRKVQWFNFVSYFILLVVIFYILKNIAVGHYLVAFIDGGFLAFIGATIFAHAKQRYALARIMLCLGLLGFLLTFNSFIVPNFPGRVYIFYNIAVIVLATFLIDDFRLNLGIGILTLLFSLAPQYVFGKENYIYKVHVHTGILFTFIFSAMYFYKRITVRYQEQLEAKNQENEMLLGEVHHRVKNNLQLIISMLRLRERQLNSEEVKALVSESREQIQTIATAHESLYKKNMGDKLEMKPYIDKLAGDIRSICAEREWRFRNHMEDLLFSADMAVPIGLILNELITNSLKYAQPKGNEALQIMLNASSLESKKIRFTFHDNGNPRPGLEEEIVKGLNTGFGIKLIRSLCKQINADWTVRTDHGFIFEFTFEPKH